LYRIRKHTDWITSVAFSPDGRLLATGDRAGGIHLWDAASGGIALSLSEHKDAIHALEWRRDSRLLASASEDGSVIVWDAKDGWPAATISKAHPVSSGSYARNKRAGVLSLAWLADGQFATAGRDRRVRLWRSGGEPAGLGDEIVGLPTRVRSGAGGDELWMGDDGGRLYRVGVYKGSVSVQVLSGIK
jgi:WD40 repeat protein